MLKNLFNKKSEDKEESKDAKQPAPRPKIVIKQRRPSSAPLPNGIANAMSPHSMPREDYSNTVETRPQSDYTREEEQPIADVDESLLSAQDNTAAPLVDASKFEAEIAALKTEKSQLQDKTLLLIEEARGLHAALDNLEKTSVEEINILKEKIEVQQTNYSALEDEFLQQKEDIDEVQDQLEQLEIDHQKVLDELENLQSVSVPKKDLLAAQAKLREEIHRKEDFESQTSSLKKDQARYETMVSELSAHITELKDSVDKGADEQMQKLMEVKDQELQMQLDRIEELEKSLKEFKKEKKQYQQLLNDKESLIESYQEYEEKYIDSQEAVQELQDALQELEASHVALEDQLSLKTTDLENVSPKITALESEINELKTTLETTTAALKESETLSAKLQSEFEAATKEWELEKSNLESKAASVSDQHSAYESKIEVLTAEKNEIETTKKELEVKIKETSEKLDATETENETLSAKLAEKEAIINSSSSASEQASEKIQELEEAIVDLNSQLEVLKASFSAEKEEYEKELSELRLASEESTDSELIKLLQQQLADKETVEQEKLKEEQALRSEISALTTQLSVLSQESNESEELGDWQQKYEDAIKREELLQADIERLKERKENEDSKESDDLVQARHKYNEALKREESLLIDMETLKAKYRNLEADAAGRNSVVSEVSGSEVTDAEVIQLRNALQALELQQGTLNAHILELETINQQLSQSRESSELNAETDSPATASNYVINLVMKPDNDEYELELPGNMNGKEIKAELTEAGLLEEGKSYDLFLPKQDAYIMNDEVLAGFNIAQGEILEIILG